MVVTSVGEVSTETWNKGSIRVQVTCRVVGGLRSDKDHLHEGLYGSVYGSVYMEPDASA